ncbi:hypothetical protein F5887DRAFT_1075932 [Amanita rubescens]|nr:hypothetical protein F5887DRAFT_1075932 [Amanita rubescens]
MNFIERTILEADSIHVIKAPCSLLDRTRTKKVLSPNPTPTPQQREPQPQPQTQLQLPKHKLKASWAIWSRRPADPSNVATLLPSLYPPQAHPPPDPDVVRQALDIRSTPPPSPPPLLSATLPFVGDEDMACTEAKEKVVVVVEEAKHEESQTRPSRAKTATAATDLSPVPSSAASVIDNSTSSTVPGSPVKQSEEGRCGSAFGQRDYGGQSEGSLGCREGAEDEGERVEGV